MKSLDDIPTHDVNHFLHELRMLRLAQLPADASVVLSAGAANQIYFDWFNENYPGRVERHIAVEFFAPPPDPMPEGVQWLARSTGDLSPVGDGEVDLVFGGQVIEHLWPDDMSGFLNEAHRVLRPGGTVVIDSPTRSVTKALGWTQPEHTIELEVDEIVELLQLAGFADIDVKGIWLCYDRNHGRVLPLDVFAGEPEWPWRRRVIEGEGRPQDSFIWWAEARNGTGDGDAMAVRRRVREIYDRARPTYFERMRSEVGARGGDGVDRYFSVPRGRRGFLLRGPSVAMPPGRHEAVFRLRAGATSSRPAPGQEIAEVDVKRDDGQVVAAWAVPARELPPGGAAREVVLPFELPDTAFYCELRVLSLGVVPLDAYLPVVVVEGAGSGRTPMARPLGRDSSRVQAQMALRRIQRAVGWPARRVLDPRLEGLRNHVQWVAGNIGARMDARANELGARIDGLAERIQPPAVDSSQSERSTILPYVLAAVGRLAPGAAILVADAGRAVVPAVLSSLGYEVITTPPEGAPQIAAAVIRAGSVDGAAVERIVRMVEPGGVVVLIAEGRDRVGIKKMLNGWQVEDETVAPAHRASVPRLTLTRASLPPAA